MKSPLRARLLPLSFGAASSVEEPAAAEQSPGAVPPTLVGPPDGATTTGASDPPIGLPALRWSPIPAANRYSAQLSPSAGFANLLIDWDTYATASSPGAALADGTYY